MVTRKSDESLSSSVADNPSTQLFHAMGAFIPNQGGRGLCFSRIQFTPQVFGSRNISPLTIE
jgi:hypothetical protein